MITSTRRRFRSLSIVLVGLAVTSMGSACAQRPAGEAGAPSSSPAASTAAGEAEGGNGGKGLSSTEELTAALLPAEAFGPDANVVTVNVQQLSMSATGGLPEGASITPEACARNVGGATQLSVEDFGPIVAQSATSATGLTVQVLAESEQIEGVTPRFDDLLAQCPQVTVNAPDGTTATIDFAALEVPALGDFSNGLSLTTAVRAPDGTNLTVPTFLAVATDDRRMIFLQQTGATSAPLDRAAFTALLEKAFEAQHNI